MGVALMMSVCGHLPFAPIAARWRTPKRCCSSAITAPRSRNSTPSDSSACVPTTPSASPLRIAAYAASRSFFFMPPRSRQARSPKMLRTAAKCCCARISVGAISTLWQPFSAAAYIKNKATAVFPLPTSPCKRRFIRRPLDISREISSIARSCAPVGANGSNSRKRARMPSIRNMGPGWARRSRRSMEHISENSSMSSKASRSFAALSVWRSGGRCSAKSACASGMRP